MVDSEFLVVTVEVSPNVFPCELRAGVDSDTMTS